MFCVPAEEVHVEDTFDMLEAKDESVFVAVRQTHVNNRASISS